MGRHHALKPHHLYLSSPNHSLTPFHLFKSPPYSISDFQRSTISTIGVRDRIPGFKISAAFFSSLHSNIFTELDSNFNSPDRTPCSLQPTVTGLPPSPLIHSLSLLTDTDIATSDAFNLPESAVEYQGDAASFVEPIAVTDGALSVETVLAEDNDMRAEALHIIADSVAQQRDIGFLAVCSHPFSVATLLAAFAAVLYRNIDRGSTNWALVAITFAGIVMILLGAIRLILGPYIFEAECVGTWSWLNRGRSADEEQATGVHVLGDIDEILVSKVGNDFVGAVVFRAIQPVFLPASPNGNKKARRARSPSKHISMLIRAWSVVRNHRRQEVGTILLESAIKVGKQKGWTINGIQFADDHANHKRILPKVFNGVMDNYERIAKNTLYKKMRELDVAPNKPRRKK